MKIGKNQIIVLYNDEGNKLGAWTSCSAAAQDLGVTTQTIYNHLGGWVYRGTKIKGKLHIETLK